MTPPPQFTCPACHGEVTPVEHFSQAYHYWRRGGMHGTPPMNAFSKRSWVCVDCELRFTTDH